MAVLQNIVNRAVSLFTKPEPPGEMYAEEIVSFVNKEFDRRQRERQPFELQWRLNLAFLEGHQFLDINTHTRALVETPRQFWWEEREVFNQIAPITEVRHAKLSRVRHILKVRPATGERRDILASKTASKLLSYVQHECALQALQVEAIMWLETMGDAFLKSVWDPRAGSPIAVDEQGNPVYEGDVCVSVHSSMEIFPYSTWENDLHRQRSIIHAKAYHVDEVLDLWGVRVDPEDVTTFSLQAGAPMGGLGRGAGLFRIAESEVRDHVIVKEYWELPTARFPNGRLLVVAGNKALHAGELPFRVGPHGKPGYPFDKIPCIIRPSCFWDKSIIERLIPVQRRYNALRNRKAEYLNRVAIGQMAVEEGSGIDIDEVEEHGAEPGKIWIYRRSSQPPKFIDNPPLPSSFETELASLMQEFIILSGVSEIAKQSNAPPGVKSGVALSIALEQDDTRLSAVALNIENAMIEQGKKWLRLYRYHASGPRLIRYVGADNVVEVVEWGKSDLSSDDVIVEGGTGLADSPAQRRQMVFDLMATGLLNDPDTGQIGKNIRRKILELLNMGHWETADDMDALHAARAERENAAMCEGAMLRVAPYDDHALHVELHNKFRLTAEYEELTSHPQIGPIIAYIFEQHISQHLAYIEHVAMQTMALQQAGLPAEQGAASLAPPPNGVAPAPGTVNPVAEAAQQSEEQFSGPIGG